MKPTTTMLLALRGGRSDRLRIGLTLGASALGAFLLLAAATIVRIPGGGGRYHNALLDQEGLHTGVIIGILGLLVALVLFVGQCSRIGAPARDRRLAGYRMAGATPGAVRRIAAAETGFASGGGAVLGVAGFSLARWIFASDPDVTGLRTLPTDVALPWWIHLAVVAAIPVAATLGALVALTSVTIDPFGVVRHKRVSAPAVAPLVMLVVGSAGLMFFSTVFRLTGLDDQGNLLPLATAFVFFILVAVGLTLGSAALGQRVAMAIAPRTRRPGLLIASRRLIDNPFQSSRPTAAVLIAVFIAAAIQQTRENFLLSTDAADTLYANTFDLLDLVLVGGISLAAAGLIVSAAEAITERRRTLAALVAGGTPRATLARASLAEHLITLVPGTIIAAITGTLIARGFFGNRVDPHLPGVGNAGGGDVLVPVPWAELGVVILGTLAVVTAVSAVALAFLPSSTSTTELRAAA